MTGVMPILLGTESAQESFTLPNAHNSLMHRPPARQRAVVSDLKRINILENQQNIKRDFKPLWNLYTTFQQRANTETIFDLDRGSVNSMTEAFVVGILIGSKR